MEERGGFVIQAACYWINHVHHNYKCDTVATGNRSISSYAVQCNEYHSKNMYTQNSNRLHNKIIGLVSSFLGANAITYNAPSIT